MGGVESNNQQSSKDLLADFTETRRQNNGVVLTDKKSENTYFLKEFNFANQNQFNSQFKRLKGLESQPQNENILPLVRLFSQTFNSICSNSYKIYALYEYPSITLEQEISARRKQDKYFDECQLWSILQSCASALSQLKPTLSIHPKNVFIVPDGVLKVINNQMVDQDYRCYLKDGVYYAPQKIREFKRNDNQNTLRKQSIFSLGMTMLHAALLNNVNSCYNYQNFQFDEGKLQKYIEELVSSQPLQESKNQTTQRGRYSEEFIEMLAMILEPNPNKRASLMQVHGMLNKVWNTETDQQNQKNGQEQHQQVQPHQTQRNIQSASQTLRESKKLQQKSINSQFILKGETQKSKQTNIIESKQQTDMKGIQSQNRSYLTSFHPSARQSKPSLSQSNNFNNKAFTKPLDMGVGSSQFTYTNTYIPTSSANTLYRPTTIGLGTTTTALPFNKQNSNIYTDPKLLQMIRKDLQDINQLKKSSMLNTYGPGYSNPYITSSSSSFYYGDIGNGMFSSKSSLGISSPNIQQIYTVNTQVNLPQKTQSFPAQNLKTQIPKTQPVQVQKSSQGFVKPAQNPIYVVQQYQDGRKFEGNLVNGSKEGHGKLTYEDGAYYQGDFKNDKMEGQGTLFYGPDRPAYQGTWLSDQFHGYGILHNQSPLELNGCFNYNDFNLIQDFWVRYEGNFDADNKAGFGKLILSNGQQFHGNFQHDIINGKGVFYTKDGQQITGIWQDNILVQLDA